MSHLVYAHIDPRTGEPFYIGKGSMLRAHDFSHRNRFYGFVLEKLSLEFLKPEVQILHECDTHEEAFELEIREISFYGRRCSGEGPLVNISEGGKGSLGLRHSKDAKISIGLAQSGKEISDYQRSQISRANKGRSLSEEHKEKIRQSHLRRLGR